MFEAIMQAFWIGTTIILGIILVVAVCIFIYMYDKLASESK